MSRHRRVPSMDWLDREARTHVGETFHHYLWRTSWQSFAGLAVTTVLIAWSCIGLTWWGCVLFGLLYALVLYSVVRLVSASRGAWASMQRLGVTLALHDLHDALGWHTVRIDLGDDDSGE